MLHDSPFPLTLINARRFNLSQFFVDSGQEMTLTLKIEDNAPDPDDPGLFKTYQLR